MKTWTVLLLSLLLAACASTPMPPRVEGLFNDRLFGPRVRAHRRGRPVRDQSGNEAVPEHHDRSGRAGPRAASWALFEALYSKGQLKLEYDSAKTRNAAQAFAARSGNCLSLVIMTAAFAKEMGTAGHLPERIPGRILGAQRRHPLLHRSRQRDAGPACNPAEQFDQSPGSPGRDRPDDRFPAAAGTPGPEHAGDRRADDRRHVPEQPRGRVVHRRAAGQCLLVGTRGNRPGPTLHERVQHAGRHLQAPRQPRRSATACSPTHWSANPRTPTSCRTWCWC